MKIIDRKEFFKLPPGTLYSEYDPLTFHSLFIKGEQLTVDYVELDLIGNIDCKDSEDYHAKIESSYHDRKSIKLDFDNYGRNGMYADDQLYAIYEKEDIEGLIYVLKKCL